MADIRRGGRGSRRGQHASDPALRARPGPRCLNLHSTTRDAFSDESEQIGLLFAARAGVAMSEAENDEHLHIALNSRDIIGQAKGILMERYKISADEAFRLLVVTSQTTNIKLHDVAEYLTRTGQLNTRAIA